jgi:exodeoxyribonuclease V alpha subunit
VHDNRAVIEGIPGTPFQDEVVIRRLRWSSDETGWAILDADRDGDEITLVGTLAHLEERERVRVSGEWQDDRRYGMQVKVASAEPLAPTGSAALLVYLKRVRHVGGRRAERLLELYGDDVLEVIDRDPKAAFRRLGLSAGRITEAVKSWDELRSSRALHLLLAPHGLAWLVPRIEKHYGPRAHRLVRERPYELTSVFGIGFHIADTIARSVDVPADSPGRVRAAVLHVLSEAERAGSTCLPVPELATRAGELLGTPPDAKQLGEMADAGTLVIELDPSNTAAATPLARDARPTAVWAYRPETAKLEHDLAGIVTDLAAAPASLKGAKAPAADDLVPAPAQAAAVEAAFASRLSIVTGGPGTGKTATIRLICAAAAEQDASILLVAPTGRAARRMSESSGLDASTVHAALGWIPGQGPTVEELDTDLLIVDETSMANLELLVTLLRAVGSTTHVVLVGDADQLAPVGAGKPFAELVEARPVPIAELTHIFRQAAGSMIVRGAHAVRTGSPPSFAPSEEMTRDLFMIERADPRAALDEVVSLVTERLPKHFGVDSISDIQVFAPVYRGALGIDALNTRLREALNPSGRKVLGGRLRIGDKLMLSGRNLHDLGLMNGTILRLLEHNEDAEALVVEADGAIFHLPEDEAPKLQLAYACSIHKGQGIELPVAILIAHTAAGAYFLRREMLYTAMTRARKATLVVGQAAVVARAAATPDTSRRYSRLGERLAASPPHPAAPAG